MTPALIFDVEGTLVDCIPQILNCWTIVLLNWGLPVKPDRLAACSGMDPNDMLARLLPHVSDKERKAIITEHAQEYRRNFLPATRALPGAADLLGEARHQGYRLALATTCDARELAHYRSLFAPHDGADCAVCGEDVPRGKPHPDLLALALKKLGGGPAVSVGDTPYDARAAREAGITPLGVLTGGFSHKDLHEAGCREVFEGPDDLRDKLSRVMAAAIPGFHF